MSAFDILATVCTNVLSQLVFAEEVQAHQFPALIFAKNLQVAHGQSVQDHILQFYSLAT